MHLGHHFFIIVKKQSKPYLTLHLIIFYIKTLIYREIKTVITVKLHTIMKQTLNHTWDKWQTHLVSITCHIASFCAEIRFIRKNMSNLQNHEYAPHFLFNYFIYYSYFISKWHKITCIFSVKMVWNENICISVYY